MSGDTTRPIRSFRDSPRWCEQCQAYGDHHTDRHPAPIGSGGFDVSVATDPT